MKVSFRSNSFNQFNVGNMKPANINNTPVQKPVIKTGEREKTSYSAWGAVIGKICGAIAGLGAIVAGVIKRKNIVGFLKKLVKSENVEKKVKEHVVKLYDDIKDDLYKVHLDEIKEQYAKDFEYSFLNGIMFCGPNGSSKEKSILELTQHLKENGWNVVHIPKFDISKADDFKFCHDYINKDICIPMSEAKKLYNQTGQHTVFVLRELDSLLENNSAASNILSATEDLQKNGCSWITDISKDMLYLYRNAKNFDAHTRRGRIDHKLAIRPLTEESKKTWEIFLQQRFDLYLRESKHMEEKKDLYTSGIVQWSLQDAIDRFPEAYRESSELYQKLKDTKFYPFEF